MASGSAEGSEGLWRALEICRTSVVSASSALQSVAKAAYSRSSTQGAKPERGQSRFNQEFMLKGSLFVGKGDDSASVNFGSELREDRPAGLAGLSALCRSLTRFAKSSAFDIWRPC